MKNYNFTGTIINIPPPIYVGKSQLKKQEFICQYTENFITNTTLVFQLLGDKNTKLISGFQKGDKVKIEFQIVCKLYNGTWYTNLDPVKITKVSSEQKKARTEKRHETKWKTYEDFEKQYEFHSGSKDYFSGCFTDEQIKIRYRELSKKNHPDLGGDVEIMKEINIQYDKIRK